MAKSRTLNFVLAGDAKGLTRAFGQGGQAAEKFEKKIDHHHQRVSASWGGMAKSAAKGAAGVAAAYVSISQAKNAISATQDLAKATGGLHRNLGLTIKEASAWAAVAKSRGIDNKALTMSFTALSRKVEDAGDGSEKAEKLFKTLGISTKDLERTHGDFNAQLGMVADGLGKLKGGTERQAAAQQLLGRGYQTILPLFTEGSKSMKEQLHLAEVYGVTLDKKTLEPVKKLTAAQRELKFAQLGLQVAFTRHTAPALLKVEQAALKVLKIMNDPDLTGEEKWKKVSKIVEPLADQLQKGVEKAVPRIAETMAENAPKAAAAFMRGFTNASFGGKLVLGAWLLSKSGGLRSFATGGARAGRTFGTAAGDTAGTTMATRMQGRMGRFGGAMFGLGKRVLGVQLALGIAAGLTSEAKGGDKVQAALSSFTFGVVPDPAKDFGKRRAGQIKEYADSIRQASRNLDTRALRASARDIDIILSSRSGADNPSTWSRDVVKAFRDVQRQANSLAGGIDKMQSAFKQLGGGNLTNLHQVKTLVKDNMRTIRVLMATDSAAAAKAMTRNLRSAGSAIRELMKDGKISTRQGMREMRRLMRDNSGASRDEMARSYRGIVRDIRKAMKDGKVTTKDGLAEIRALTKDYLKQFGYTGRQADLYLQNRNPNTGGPEEGTANVRQRGGYIQYGKPGEKGRDTIPTVIAGQPAMVAPGEVATVFTGDQQSVVNEALMDRGIAGLPGLFRTFDRPHSAFARGGYAGLKPGIAAAAKTLTAKFPLAITSTTGGHHAPGSYHYRGLAADFGGSPGVMFQASQWIKSSGMARSLTEGIHNPNLSIKGGQSVPSSFWGAKTWGDHGNHIHLAIAGALGAFGAGAAQQIKRLVVRGPESPLKRIVQRAIDANRSAANTRLADASMPDTGAPSSGGGQYGFQQLRQLWTQAGGDPKMASLMAHIAIAESGGDPSARNPSGASGLWQILGKPFPGNAFDPLTNARMAVWKLKHQGLGAWAASRGAWGRYVSQGAGRARGGFVGFNRGGSVGKRTSIFGHGQAATPRAGGRRQTGRRPGTRRHGTRLTPVTGGTRGSGTTIGTGMTVGEPGENLAEPATLLDYIEQNTALAGLTEDLSDDITAADQSVMYYEALLAKATDPKARGEAAGALKGARDTRAALNGPGAADQYGQALSDIDAQERAGILSPADADTARAGVRDAALRGDYGQLTEREKWQVMGDIKDAAKELADSAAQIAESQKAIADEMKKTREFNERVERVSGTEAVKFMADHLSGYIGQRVGQRVRTPGRGYVASA